MLSLGLWGIPVAVAGLAFVLLGLSAGLALSVIGTLVATLGLLVLARDAEARISRRRAARERDRQSG